MRLKESSKGCYHVSGSDHPTGDQQEPQGGDFAAAVRASRCGAGVAGAVTEVGLQQKRPHTAIVPSGPLCQGTSVKPRQGWALGTGFSQWDGNCPQGLSQGQMALQDRWCHGHWSLQGTRCPQEARLTCFCHPPPARPSRNRRWLARWPCKRPPPPHLWHLQVSPIFLLLPPLTDVASPELFPHPVCPCTQSLLSHHAGVGKPSWLPNKPASK